MSWAPAAEVTPEHREAVLKMLKATRQKEIFEKTTMGAVRASMEEMKLQVPIEKQEAFGRAVTRVVQLLEEELGWDKLQDQVVALYAERLSLADLNELVPLLENPAMQKYLTISTEVGTKIGEVNREMMSKIQPKIFEIIQEEMGS